MRFGLDDGKLFEILGVNKEKGGRIYLNLNSPEMF